MLKTVNPLVKLALCLLWMVAAIAVFDLRFQIAVILIVAGARVLLARIPVLFVLALMVPFALFGFGFLTTSVLFRQEVDFAVYVADQTAFSSPAFSAGLTLFARAIAVGMVSAFFVMTTDPGGFVRALMAYCGLSPRVGYALFSILQLVPEIAAEARQVRLARAMKRGRPPRRFPGPAETAGLLIPVLAFALRRASRTAIALEARGLRPNAPRTLIDVPPFSCRDLFFALAAVLLLFCLFAGIVPEAV